MTTHEHHQHYVRRAGEVALATDTLDATFNAAFAFAAAACRSAGLVSAEERDIGAAILTALRARGATPERIYTGQVSP